MHIKAVASYVTKIVKYNFSKRSTSFSYNPFTTSHRTKLFLYIIVQQILLKEYAAEFFEYKNSYRKLSEPIFI